VKSILIVHFTPFTTLNNYGKSKEKVYFNINNGERERERANGVSIIGMIIDHMKTYRPNNNHRS